MKRDVMIDLETLSTRPDAVIVSIGACAFDLEGIAEPFYTVIDITEQRGRHIDAATVAWWMAQSDPERAVFKQVPTTVGHALFKLGNYIGEHLGTLKDRRVWGNGADFDNVLLSGLYRWQNENDTQAELQPWSHLGNRCFRTLKNLMPKDYEVISKQVPRVTFHNAADDARWQAEIARRLLALLDDAIEVAYGIG